MRLVSDDENLKGCHWSWRPGKGLSSDLDVVGHSRFCIDADASGKIRPEPFAWFAVGRFGKLENEPISVARHFDRSIMVIPIIAQLSFGDFKGFGFRQENGIVIVAIRVGDCAQARFLWRR